MTDEARHLAIAAAALEDRQSNRFKENAMNTRKDIARQLRASAEALDAGAPLDATQQLLRHALDRLDQMRSTATRNRMVRAAQKAQDR